MKITLCGSRRFWKEFVQYNRELSLMGHVVYTLGVFRETGEAEMELTDHQKQILDLVHLAKIEESDAILVLDVSRTADGGWSKSYIGESTTREIEWTRLRGKKVYWLSNETDRNFLERASCPDASS